MTTKTPPRGSSTRTADGAESSWPTSPRPADQRRRAAALAGVVARGRGPVPAEALGVDDARVTGDVEVAVTATSSVDGIVVHGTVSTPWDDECRRCLRDVDGVAVAEVDERYQVDPALAGRCRDRRRPDRPRSDGPRVRPARAARRAAVPRRLRRDLPRVRRRPQRGAVRLRHRRATCAGRRSRSSGSTIRATDPARSGRRSSFRSDRPLAWRSPFRAPARRPCETRHSQLRSWRPAVAVPKKKKSKMKSRSHRAGAWKLAAPARSTCPRCGNAKTPHTVCPTCGWYKNRVAVEVG